METQTKGANATAKNEISISRVLNAPRELVWEVWTNPKHIVNWWGPTGFSDTIKQMDVRPGGAWLHTMHGPDGKDYVNETTYTEVVKPERLAYSHITPKFDATVVFEKQGNKTKLTMTMVFADTEEYNFVVKEHGAIEGQQQTIARLEEYLSQVSERKPLVITRIFNAPRELVFKVWTEPKHLSQWWGPNGFTAPVCEVDLKPGGALRIHMEHPDFPNHWMKGVFKEIVPPEKLVFTNSAFIGEDGEAGIEGICTVTFEDYNGKTKMTLVAEVTKLAPEFSFAYEGMNEGWNQSLDKLADYINSLK